MLAPGCSTADDKFPALDQLAINDQNRPRDGFRRGFHGRSLADALPRRKGGLPFLAIVLVWFLEEFLQEFTIPREGLRGIATLFDKGV